MNNNINIAKHIPISHNVSIRVLDKDTLKVVQEHTGHNAATNSLLTGIGYYLIGEGVLGQGSAMLKDYVPQYISLGTMGLAGQSQSEDGLPLDIGMSASSGVDDTTRYTKYMDERPGFGADGYDANANHGRPYFGLGYPYESYDRTRTYQPGDVVIHNTDRYRCINATELGEFDSTKWELWPFDGDPDIHIDEVGFEAISPTYLRSKIAYRDVVPEIYAETANTIDIVFSAMISTGALAQFRGNNDYLFISEAGLWSRPTYAGSSAVENGLLAGYRIVPPDSSNWDMSDAANRAILQHNILRVGVNQVVQVIWKIQLGDVSDDSSST